MDRVTIQDALDYCLGNPEGLSAQQLLERFPEYRDELAPLLGLASQINVLSAPAISPARREAMKASLIAAAAAHHSHNGKATAETLALPVQAVVPAPTAITSRRKRPLPWYLK